MGSFDSKSSNSPDISRHKSASTKKIERMNSNQLNLGDKALESGAGRQLTMNDNRKGTKEGRSPAGIRSSLLLDDAQQA